MTAMAMPLAPVCSMALSTFASMADPDGMVWAVSGRETNRADNRRGSCLIICDVLPDPLGRWLLNKRTPGYGRDWPRDWRAFFMPRAAELAGSSLRAAATLEAEVASSF